MRVAEVRGTGTRIYSSNVYLVMGEWRRLEDINTLIDVGSDPSILETLSGMETGVGKKKVEQVVLTHGHPDHTAVLPRILEVFRPRVLAFSRFLPGVNTILQDGAWIRMGDREFEVIHMPGHTEDSILLYCREERTLFSGDSALIIKSPGGTYGEAFQRCLEKLCRRDIERIYFGHGPPLCRNVAEQLRTSLRHIRASVRQPDRSGLEERRPPPAYV